MWNTRWRVHFCNWRDADGRILYAFRQGYMVALGEGILMQAVHHRHGVASPEWVLTLFWLPSLAPYTAHMTHAHCGYMREHSCGATMLQ